MMYLPVITKNKHTYLPFSTMIGKKLVSMALSVGLLSGYIAPLQGVNAQTYELSLSQAGITTITSGGSSGECLPSDRSYDINSIRDLGAQLEVQITLTDTMSKTIQPNTAFASNSLYRDVNRWRDANFRFLLSNESSPSTNGYSDTKNWQEVHAMKATYSGKIGTFVFNKPSYTYQARNSSGNNRNTIADYLVMYPDTAYVSHYQSTAICDGFLKSRLLPTDTTYSVTDNNNNQLNLKLTSVSTNDSLATATLTGATGLSVAVNGTTVASGTGGTTVTLSRGQSNNTITGIDNVPRSFYGPTNVTLSRQSCYTPTPFSTFWNSSGYLIFEMYPAGFSGYSATQYNTADQYQYKWARFRNSAGPISEWLPTTGSYNSSSNIITHTFTTMPSGATSVEFMTSQNFTTAPYDWYNGYTTFYCSQIGSNRTTAIPTKPANLAVGPVIKEFRFSDKEGEDIFIRGQSVPGADTSLQVFNIHSGGQSIQANGVTIAQGSSQTLTGLAADQIINITLPSEPGFTYSFIKPDAGELAVGDFQTAQLSGWEDGSTAGVVFKKDRYSDNGSSRYKARLFTHYRYEYLENGFSTLSDWLPLAEGTNYTNSTAESTVKYSLPNLPTNTQAIDFTVAPSTRKMEGVGDEPRRVRTWDQLSNIKRVLITPQQTDFMNPIVLGMLIDTERSGFVRTPSITVRPVAFDDQGINRCYAGYAADGLDETIVDCTSFNWNVFPNSQRNGTSTLYFRAVDTSGKTSATFARTIHLDTDAPTISELAALQAMPWQNTPYQVSLTATDNANGSGVLSTRYSLYAQMPASCATTDITYSEPFSVEAHRYLCLSTEDTAGNKESFGPYQIRIDTTLPTVSNMVVEDAGAMIAETEGVYSITNYTGLTDNALQFNANTGKYYTKDGRFTLLMEVQDNRSGVNNDSCTIVRNGSTMAARCISIASPGIEPRPYLIYRSATPLANGEYTYTLNASDQAGNVAATSTVRIVVDTTAPTAPEPGTITPDPDSNPDTNGNSITYTLPNLTDLGGSGIDRIELALTQNGQPFTVDPSMLGGNDPRITIENGIVIIRPDINNQLPTSVQLINLPGTVEVNGEVVQAEYQGTFTIYDRAGNSTPVVTPPVRFDTLSPSIITLSPVPGSVEGNGMSSANPFRVGSGRTLPLVFTLEELSNSTSGNPSLPLSIQLQGSGVTMASGQTNIGCSTLENNRCTLPVTYSVLEGFNGQVQFTVQDSAGNTSAPLVRYIMQSNGAPQVQNPDPTAPNGDVSVLPALGNRFNGERLQVTLRNVSLGNATQLNARLRYTERTNEQNIVNAIVTAGQEANSYVLSFTLPSANNPSAMREGAQNAQLILSNEFGNNNEAAPIVLPLQYDITAPAVSNFRYSWNDDTDRVTLQWDSITEASNTTNLEYRVHLEGNTSNWSSTPLTSGMTSYELPVTIAANDATIDVRFNDGSVYTLTAGGSETLNPNTTSMQVARKDIVINFNANAATESLLVTFATAAGVDVSTIQSLVTTLNRPGGAALTSTIPPIPAGNTLFTIAQPRAGIYQALAELEYSNNSMGALTFTKSETIADIIAPQGTLSLASNPAVREEQGTYYVSGENTVTLQYGINAGVEESYPVTVALSSTFNGTTTSLPGAANLTAVQANNSITVPLAQDGAYTLTAVFTDGAGLTDTETLTIVKDSDIIVVSTRLLDSSNQAITTTDSANDLYTKLRTGVQMEVVVANEPGTLQYYINGQEITNAQTVTGLPANQTGVRLPLADLNDNALNTLTMRVVDSATNEGIRTVRVRVDNRGPEITGTISIPSETRINPIILNGVTITDYSPVRYRVVSASGTLEGLFTNGIALPEGTNAFTLTFLDALGNESQANNGQSYNVFVDSQSPEATATIAPDRTRARAATVTISNVQDTSDEISYEIARGAIIISSGTIARSNYASTTVNLDLTSIINTTGNLTVRLTDQTNNIRPINLPFTQDEEGPNVSFGTTSTINGGIGIGWPLTITDDLSTVSTVTGVISNTSTGEQFSIAHDAWQTGANGLYVGGILPPNVRAGSIYVLTVNATDSLGNSTENMSSAPFTMPPAAGNEDDDPLVDGPEIDPTITGTTIDVTVSNGRDINFTVEDLPRGTQIVLGYILDQYNEQNPASPITVLPIGEYIITIVDNLGNIQQNTHTITPYYLSTTGDLNGDGFGGGITDHRLFTLAREAGRYDMNSPAIVTAVNAISTIIDNRMNNEFTGFLRDGLIYAMAPDEESTIYITCSTGGSGCAPVLPLSELVIEGTLSE